MGRSLVAGRGGKPMRLKTCPLYWILQQRRDGILPKLRYHIFVSRSSIQRTSNTCDRACGRTSSEVSSRSALPSSPFYRWEWEACRRRLWCRRCQGIWRPWSSMRRCHLCHNDWFERWFMRTANGWISSTMDTCCGCTLHAQSVAALRDRRQISCCSLMRWPVRPVSSNLEPRLKSTSATRNSDSKVLALAGNSKNAPSTRDAFRSRNPLRFATGSSRHWTALHTRTRTLVNEQNDQYGR